MGAQFTKYLQLDLSIQDNAIDLELINISFIKVFFSFAGDVDLANLAMAPKVIHMRCLILGAGLWQIHPKCNRFRDRRLCNLNKE